MKSWSSEAALHLNNNFQNKGRFEFLLNPTITQGPPAVVLLLLLLLLLWFGVAGPEDESQSTGIDDASQGSKFSCQKPGFSCRFLRGKWRLFFRLVPKIQGPTKTSPKWEWIFPAHFLEDSWPLGFDRKELKLLGEASWFGGYCYVLPSLCQGLSEMSFGAQLGPSFENFGFADTYPSRKTLASHSFEGTIFLLRDVLKVSTCFFWTWTCWTRRVLMLGNESEEGGKDRVFPFFYFFCNIFRWWRLDLDSVQICCTNGHELSDKKQKD